MQFCGPGCCGQEQSHWNLCWILHCGGATKKSCYWVGYVMLMYAASTQALRYPDAGSFSGLKADKACRLMWHTIHLSFLIVRPRSLSHRPSHLEVHIAETQWKHQDHSRICQHVQIDPLLVNQWTAEGFFSQSCWSDEFFSGRAVNSTSGLFEDGSWSKDNNKMVKEEMPANFSTPRYILNSGSWCVIPIPICAGWSDEHCTCSTTRKSPRCKKVNQGKKNLKGWFFITQKNYAEKYIYR